MSGVQDQIRDQIYANIQMKLGSHAHSRVILKRYKDFFLLTVICIS